MKIFVTSDTNWETKVNHALKVLQLCQHFEGMDFGSSLADISIILMCRPPELHFKQRIRMEQKERCLGMDIMLPYNDFVTATHAKRRKLVAEALLTEVPRVLGRYQFDDFKATEFLAEFSSTVQNQLLGDSANRFDHLCLETANHSHH